MTDTTELFLGATAGGDLVGLALLLALGIFTFFLCRSDTPAISSRLPTGRPAKSAPNPNAANAPAFQKGEQAVQAHEEEVKKEAEAASGVKSHAEVEKAAKAKAAAKKEDEEVLEEEADAPKPKPAKPAAKTKSPAPAAGARLPAVEKALELINSLARSKVLWTAGEAEVLTLLVLD